MNKHLITLGIAIVLICVGLSGCEENFQNGKQEPETGNTIIVTSTADAGPGTLRQALLDSRSGDTIIFDPEAFHPRFRYLR